MYQLSFWSLSRKFRDKYFVDLELFLMFLYPMFKHARFRLVKIQKFFGFPPSFREIKWKRIEPGKEWKSPLNRMMHLGKRITDGNYPSIELDQVMFFR